MQDDWSDAWLQQAAGWKAVKEGLSLHDRGLVQNASCEGDECRGIVQGGKALRVRVKRLNASSAETFCSCPENQRSGAMCGHAVAVIIAARKGKQAEQSGTPTPVIQAAATPTAPALRVNFFPNWQQQWKKHRFSVKIEKSTRQAEESDQVLWEWLLRQGVTQKTSPWLLHLGPGLCEELFECLLDHEDIHSEKQTIVFSSAAPEIEVSSQARAGGWLIVLRQEPGVFLGQKCSDWLHLNEQTFKTNNGFTAKFLYQLFTEKYTLITYSEYFESIELQRSLRASDPDDSLNQWRSITVDPQWEVEVEGSLRQLRLRARKHYRSGCEAIERPLFGATGYLWQQGDLCCYANQHDESPLVEILRQQGWQWQKDEEIWILAQEDQILQFISEGREQLRSICQRFTESDPWREIQKKLIIVQPSIEVTTTNSREIQVDLQFSSNAGQALDSAKIRQLLGSGKRLIQTNDGKSLLLPKETWEVFQRTATDLHWQQQKGAFLAQKSQSLLIEYLRKYVTNRLICNDLKLSTYIDFPLMRAQLREYQLQGARWLMDRLESHGFALLADEMGLGKTLQTIAMLTHCATTEQPALIVVPTSLLYNWESEIRRFAPSLQTIVLHGSNREGLHEDRSAQVIVTSYGVLMRDRALFMKRDFSVMVLDEASAIRNPDTDIARCCYRIKARRKLALTGTPLENSMEDLWSIFQYLQPGYLGDRQQFRDTYERSGADPVALQSLRLRVMPFLLRRTKSEVLKDLPDKVESDEWCEMSPDQQKLYQSTWELGAANIEKLTKAQDSAAYMTLLTLLLRLRQICCDAGLFAPELLKEWTLEQRSSKMVRLLQWLDETRRSGRKMLVFSQFATQLRTIEAECSARGISVLRLDGATRNRQELVDRFQNDPSVTAFLISLKAGGYGLNLTAATTVVHFDPWWNPAAEQQASDRAHRIGQSHAVNVYKLLTRGSVEERVKRLQADKSRMVAQLLGGAATPAGLGAMPSMKEISDLLSLDTFPSRNR